MKTRFFPSFVSVLAFLLRGWKRGASPQYTALGTGFTYQGSLTDGGVPADGLYDLSVRTLTMLTWRAALVSPIDSDGRCDGDQRPVHRPARFRRRV